MTVRGADLWQWVNTFSEVLSIMVVNLTQAPISFHQVVLGATQVDLTVLPNMTHRHKHATERFIIHWDPGSFRKPCHSSRSVSPRGSFTSSQFCSSFTQNRARWKLLLSVRSERQKWQNTTEFSLQQQQTSNQAATCWASSAGNTL